MSAAVSIQDQADFLREIVSRTLMRDGSIAAEAHLTLSKSDAEKLEAVSLRLERIAPHEAGIRKMVTGR